MINELALKSRSYRRFYQDEQVSIDTLRNLVELGRLSPTGANLQPLKYILSNNPEKNALIFSTCSWAGYLKEWPGPEEGERPSAYIIILGDMAISRTFGTDHGIAAQSIMLGAVELGLGGCMIGSIKRGDLSKALNIPTQYEVLLVLALGKTKETVVLDPIGPDGNIKYWRDEQQVHHVPKRSLEDIIIEI
jgi:nitroreductase